MFKKNVLFNANLDGLADIPAWYTLVTSYNYESQVADKLNKMASNDYKNVIFEAFPGTQLVNNYYKNKKGKIAIRKKYNKQYMNYAFCKCKMTPEIWNAIIGITGVGSIMCVSGAPVSTPEKEILKIRDSLKTINIYEDEIISDEKVKELEELLDDKYKNI